MSIRRAIVTFAAVAVLGIAALAAAGAGDQRWTAFSPGVPPVAPVATLKPSEQTCSSPLLATASFASVRSWVTAPSAPGASLQMQVRSAHGGTLATAAAPRGYVGQTTLTFPLTHTVASGQPVSVCFRSGGPASVSLLGAGSQVALLFLRRQPQSLLSAIPTAFRRAALFKPTWVGTWTFWVLLALLLAAFASGGIAVLRAAQADVNAQWRASREPERLI